MKKETVSTKLLTALKRLELRIDKIEISQDDLLSKVERLKSDISCNGDQISELREFDSEIADLRCDVVRLQDDMRGLESALEHTNLHGDW